jgi:hypothetical protein
MAELVPSYQSQTTHWAEIYALERVIRDFKLRRAMMEPGWATAEAIVVVMDSDYVYLSITECVWTWEQVNFRPPKGTYEHALLLLHRAILSIEQSGVKFLFWKVWNAVEELHDASCLAVDALQQA